MKKTLYSLMLSDEVVAEVDRLAHRLGTNRSNLINQILAEHVNLVTPERRINDIFSAIEQLMTPSRELVPFVSPNTMTMSLKSSLEYKYRPTVKYEVELYRGDRTFRHTEHISAAPAPSTGAGAHPRCSSRYERIPSSSG